MNFQRELNLQNKFKYVIGVDEAGRGPLAGPVVAAAFCFLTDQESFIKQWPWSHIADSKTINEQEREKLFDSISAETENLPAFCYGYSVSDVQEIDDLNILNATLLAMSRATFKVVRGLLTREDANENQTENKYDIKVLVDGNRVPPLQFRPLTQDGNLPSNVQTPPPKQRDPKDSAWWTDCYQYRINRLVCETIVKGDSSVMSIAAASIVAKVVRDRIMRKLHDTYPQYNLAVHKGYPTPEHKKLVRTLGPSKIHRMSFEPCLTLIMQKTFELPEGRDIKRLQERLAAAKGKKRARYPSVGQKQNQMVLATENVVVQPQFSGRKMIKKSS